MLVMQLKIIMVIIMAILIIIYKDWVHNKICHYQSLSKNNKSGVKKIDRCVWIIAFCLVLSKIKGTTMWIFVKFINYPVEWIG